MINLYARLWENDADSWRPGITSTVILILYSLILPVIMGLGINDSKYGILAVVLVGVSLILILFFNVKTYVIYLLPLMFSYNNYYLIIVIMAVLMFSFFAYLIRQNKIEIEAPTPILLLFMILSIGIGFSRSIHMAEAKFFLIFTLILPLIAFILFYNLRLSASEIRSFLFPVCVIGASIGYISLALWIATGIPRIVFTWPATSQNQGAGFLGLLLPYSLIALLDARGKLARSIWFLIFMGVMCGIFTSQTRALLLTVFLAMAYISITDKRAMKVILPVMLVAIVTLPALLLSRFAILFGQADEVDWSSVGRIEIWLNSIAYIKEHYLLGMGLDNYRYYYALDHPKSVVAAVHPHNIAFKWILDFGLIGFLTYSYFFTRIILRGILSINKRMARLFPQEYRLLLALNAAMIMLMTEGIIGSYLNDFRSAILVYIYLAFISVFVNQFQNYKVPVN
ncbi:O-antigen ligase family protein [Calditrichota bacterium]